MKPSSIAPLLLFVLACDPPCPSYWQFRCDSCGPDSEACAHAKHASKHELSEEGKCERLSSLASSESDFTRERYCNLHEKKARSLDDLRGPWSCEGRRVSFEGPAEESKRTSDPQQLVVDGARTTIWNVGHSFFQIEGAPACTYWLLPHEESNGDVGLTLSCPKPVGGLEARMIRCTKP